MEDLDLFVTFTTFDSAETIQITPTFTTIRDAANPVLPQEILPATGLWISASFSSEEYFRSARAPDGFTAVIRLRHVPETSVVAMLALAFLAAASLRTSPGFR